MSNHLNVTSRVFLLAATVLMTSVGIAGTTMTAHAAPTTLTGITATTAQAAPATTAKAKPAKNCPLTDDEKRGNAGFFLFDASIVLAPYPTTMYTAPGAPLRIITGWAIPERPIGKLTVATKRGPRTVVPFCADRYGTFDFTFPADTVTGPASVAFSSRDGKSVTQRKFKIVALDAVPTKPVSPTDVQAEVRDDGLFFTWTSLSPQPGLEHYVFPCQSPILPMTTTPAILVPNKNVNPRGTFTLRIASINLAGWSEIKTIWQYDLQRRTITRVY